MWKKFLLAIPALLALVVVIAAFQPDQYQVSRTSTIAAPVNEVFEQVNDMHKMDAWSPWLAPDPHAKKTFEGPASGQGAIFSWAGNSEVGEGRMTNIDSRPPDFIRFKMEFLKPMVGFGETVFTFRADGGQTVITQTMTGKKNFLSKLMCMFMSMDKMIGTQFEKGFANMNALLTAKK